MIRIEAFGQIRILFQSCAGLKMYRIYRARICKRLRSPGIDFKESIPPAYVASRAGTSIGFRAGPPGWESIPGLHKKFTNSGSGKINITIKYFQAPEITLSS
jgi:hypothetical protein